MSWGSCSVKVSSHGPMGDTHDESQGSPPRGAAPQQAAGATTQTTVSEGGRRGAAPSLARPAVDARAARGGAAAGARALADDLPGHQRLPCRGEVAGGGRPPRQSGHGPTAAAGGGAAGQTSAPAGPGPRPAAAGSAQGRPGAAP